MGNSLVRGRKEAKIMKISGESFKLKIPSTAYDVLKYYPTHVLMEAEAIKRYGIRAKPLGTQEKLERNKVYFLVELPKFPQERVPRRTRSTVQMSVKDRLESLKLKRSASENLGSRKSLGAGPFQVKIKLPRSKVAKMIKESKDSSEMADKIIDYWLRNSNVDGEGPFGDD